MLNRITQWMIVEPVTALMMIIAAVVLFSTSFTASRGDPPDRLWPWLRRVVEAAVKAGLFLGLLWAFRSILKTNSNVYHATHGSLSDANLTSAQSIWGRPHIQRELGVTHYITKTVQEEIPRADPADPPLYRDVEVRQVVPQNSILSSTGDIHLTLSERRKGYALYNGFVADGSFEYEVINDSDLETEAEFYFPLSLNQTMYEYFEITADGEDISPLLRFSGDAVYWAETMSPHESQTITVDYQVRGMEYIYYQIPTQREIRDFSLTITVDRLPVSQLNYPEGCLTPMDIRPTGDGQGSVLVWTLDRAVTTAGMGIALPQPEQPGAKVLRSLREGPYALTLLIATLSLTLLILGEPVRFLDLALLSSAYCVQFLLMAAFSDYFLGFWGSLVLGAALTGFLTFLLFRHHPSTLLRVLIGVLVFFFTIVHPLSGLLTEVTHRNSFDTGVQLVLITYLFVLSLHARLRAVRAGEAAGAGAA